MFPRLSAFFSSISRRIKPSRQVGNKVIFGQELSMEQAQELIKPLPEHGLLKKRLEAEKSKLESELAYGLQPTDLPPEHRNNETLRKLLSTEMAPIAERYNTLKHRLMSYYARRTNDTGSPEAQIASITVHMDQLALHTSQHRHDHKASRKAVMLMHQRKRLLKYLRKVDLHRYYGMLEELGLRRDYLERFENKYFFHGQQIKHKVHRTVRGGGTHVTIPNL